MVFVTTLRRWETTKGVLVMAQRKRRARARTGEAKPAPQRRPRVRSATQAETPPRTNPLITPECLEIARRLRSGKMKADVRWSDPNKWSPSHIPRELLPFFESLDLSVLADLLGEDPKLYWHPVIRNAVWWVSDRRYKQSPEESAAAEAAFTKLLESHVLSLMPFEQQVIIGKRLPAKRGPKGIRNPHPGSPGLDWIEPGILHGDWLALRAKLADRRKDIPSLPVPEEGREHAKDCLQRLGLEALTAARLPPWSSLREEVLTDERSVVDPGSHQAHWRIHIRWNVDLRPLLDELLRGKFAAIIKKEGVPGAFACIVLATLLNTTPQRIYDAVTYQRRKEGKRPAGTSGTGSK